MTELPDVADAGAVLNNPFTTSNPLNIPLPNRFRGSNLGTS